ncbi:hypothetical protein IC803_11925 [Geobacillus sp. 46C-IIa]|uniref:hypothetical protein n=1 Tax=Geobacillus sp. 46C-IIa TaxID=1963025 RepID=UPI001301AA8B|nr:hypothetical protein [Geobacillus sp. 46C-IIa]QNU27016.1 hypothetical protein IC803_11925 [Geobacillus sp. 46C-IIa]
MLLNQEGPSLLGKGKAGKKSVSFDFQKNQLFLLKRRGICSMLEKERELKEQ